MAHFRQRAAEDGGAGKGGSAGFGCLCKLERIAGCSVFEREGRQWVSSFSRAPLFGTQGRPFLEGPPISTCCPSFALEASENRNRFSPERCLPKPRRLTPPRRSRRCAKSSHGAWPKALRQARRVCRAPRLLWWRFFPPIFSFFVFVLFCLGFEGKPAFFFGSPNNETRLVHLFVCLFVCLLFQLLLECLNCSAEAFASRMTSIMARNR